MKQTYTTSIFFIILFTTVLLSQGCLKENEEDLFPNSDCDTTSTISYVNDILPTIQNQCYACHSQQAQIGGIILEGHANFSAYATLVLTAISRDPSEPKFMPNGGSPLPDCFKQKLQVWINRGSNNN
jgi:uncharacterized membrane protein